MSGLKTRHEIQYKGLKLEVAGYYFNGYRQTYLQPEEPPEFNVHEVYLFDTDITELFNCDMVDDLESIILNEHYS